jgi:DNA polymerase-3 subunit chi
MEAMMTATGDEGRTEALFYHLERQPLDKVLPSLVERTLERGWRAVIQAGSKERLAALDTLLWTYRDDSFLAHGTAADGSPEDQPVYLTVDGDNPNGAAVRFLVDGARADAGEWAGTLLTYRRAVVIFDGSDSDAIAAAREQWQFARKSGCAVTYWQQGEDGRWMKRA